MSGTPKSTIDMMLDGLAWEAVEGNAEYDDDLPYATHSGVLEIMGRQLRCYRLSNGMCVFDADDVNAFFSNAEADDEPRAK